MNELLKLHILVNAVALRHSVDHMAKHVRPQVPPDERDTLDTIDQIERQVSYIEHLLHKNGLYSLDL